MELKSTVRLNGLEEALREVGPKLARKALRKAVAAAGDMWVDEIRAKVPVATGDLRDSIAKKVSTRRRAGVSSARVKVGPSFDNTVPKGGDQSQSPGVYGQIVERGNKRQGPRPFMRPVFDATAERAVQIVADVLRDELNDM